MVRLKFVVFAAVLAVILFTHAGQAQVATTISVFQGNGQLICDGCATTALPLFDPLIVKVTDANGNPVPNTQVTWQIISSTGQVTGSVQSATTLTGSSTSSSAVDCNLYSTSTPPPPQKIGETCNIFTEGSTATPQLGFIVTTLQASIPGQTVTFTLTQSPLANTSGSGNNSNYIYAQICSSTLTCAGPVTPDSPIQVGTTVSGPVGSVSTSPIKVSVQSVAGNPFQSISVRLIPVSPTQGGAAIICQSPASRNADPGSVLTDPTGIALCYPMFTAPGSTPMNFDILVGGVLALTNPGSVNSFNSGLGNPAGPFSFGPFRATATPNTPSSLQLVSGNNQTANAGSMLGQPLVVQVSDSSSRPLQGIAVSWAVTQPNSSAAVVSPASPTSDSNGKVSANVTLTASASGNVTVTATVGSTSPPLTQSFSITAIVPAPPLSSLTIVSGSNNQSAVQGSPFGMPLAVMASLANGAPAANVTVQFAITGGSGMLSAPSAMTQSNGQASVGITAGSTPGPLTVVATAGGLSQTFNLTVLPPPPPITFNSFLNGAGFYPTVASSGSEQWALSPCSIGTLVVGSPLASAGFPATANMYTTPLQQTNNISIVFNPPAGTSILTAKAPLLNVATATTSQQLITFQVPCELVPNYYAVTVTLGSSAPVTIQGVPVRPGSPGIFEMVGSDGVRRAIAVRPDGSIVSSSNPGRKGEFLRIYITGAGPVSPPLVTGSLPTPGLDATPVEGPGQVIVGLNNSGVGGVTVKTSPELIGVYEVRFLVPSDSSVHSGDNLLAVVVTAQGNTQVQQPSGSQLPLQ